VRKGKRPYVAKVAGNCMANRRLEAKSVLLSGPARRHMVASTPMKSAQHDAVELTEGCGEWFVRIVQNGQEQVASFEVEAYALAYAEGQRIRLGLDAVRRT
jgi:hypothetical protein